MVGAESVPGVAADERAEELAQQLTDIARVLLGPGSVEETLRLIVALAVDSIEGCDEAGLCEAEGVPGLTLPTSPVLAELDELQTALQEGPCVEALGGANSVYVGDVTESDRWPQFGPHVAAAGLRSALAYRLFAGTETLGALQLYARLPWAFNATDRAQGLIFAAHAGLALSIARSQEAAQGKVDNLQHALASREIIGQAQGILMERERITAEQAFELLRRASQRLNLKLRAVAQEIVDTGVVPNGNGGDGSD